MDSDPQVSSVVSDSVTNLPQRGSVYIHDNRHSFAGRQREDRFIRNMTVYLEQGTLPDDPHQSQKIAAQSIHFTLLDGILYYIDSKSNNQKRAVAPQAVQLQILRGLTAWWTFLL